MRVEIWTRAYRRMLFVTDTTFVPPVGCLLSLTGDDDAGTVLEVTFIAAENVVMSDITGDDS